MSYLESLNEPQREAVTYDDGPLMIIAGAGSGKTRVLTYRIARLMQDGVEPFNILALTFTNKAAREMRERIESVVGTEARNLWMGTFHSVFAKILRFEGHRIGYDSNFTIYDSDDSKSLIKAIVKEMKLNDKIYKPNAVLSRISSAKNNLISWRAYEQNAEFLIEDEAAARPHIHKIYKEYSIRCFRANAMDFDDLLFNTNVLFHQHLDALNKYQHKFQHVMIDEFQDTNLSQYGITRKLSSVHQNICVVGDDAQSIYAFRGANIQNILNFEKDYPDLKVVKLEQNYRSTQNIVKAANSVIRYNTKQLRKEVWTENLEGNKVELVKAVSDHEEGKLIASSIFEAKMQHSLNNSDFAVLYRTNAQSRSIEESLRRMNIPYKIIGGLSFYQRKEVKDMVAYLRATINPNDEEAFRRIINYPKRGIGTATINKILLKAQETSQPVWEIASNVRQYFQGERFLNSIDEFATMIKAFRLAVDKNDAFTAASRIAKDSGMLKELYDDKTVEGRVRYDNLQELLNAIKGFVDNPENENKSLEFFLQEVSLVSTADTNTDPDSVTLMTIHMSKGLEFKYVYISGLEENLFPSQMMLQSREDLEEERRLFYVAITRAEQQLCLSYALQRYRYGKLIPGEPSRFLEEIDPSYINHVRKGGSSGGGFGKKPWDVDFGNAPTSSFGKPSSFASQFKQKTTSNFTKVSAKQKHTLSSNFKPTPSNQLQAGNKVEHQKFGFGTIASIEEYGNDKRAKINFKNVGEKTLILSFAKLMVVE